MSYIKCIAQAIQYMTAAISGSIKIYFYVCVHIMTLFCLKEVYDIEFYSSVQSLSRVQLFAIPWIAGLPVHHQLPEFTQTQVRRVGDAIQ